ncbi:MAG: TolB family protein [Gaiellaceae bacterium]
MSRSRIRRPLLFAFAAVLASVAASVASSNPGPSAWPTQAVIAYKCADSLCLTEPGGGAPRRLLATNRPWPQWDPAFSPDGHEIAFRGYWGPGDGAYALYVASRSGCTARRLTRSVASDPSWSPDGRWIVFDTSGYGDIYKVHPNGTALTKLFTGHGVKEGGYPAWSPDGRRIAYVRDQRHGSQIWLMRPDGSDKHLLHIDATAVDQGLTWSHDGRWLAFDRTATNYGTIAVIRADGSDMHTLTSGSPTWNPVWLPSDTGIAYLAGTANSNGTIAGGSLYVMRPDGTGKHRLAGPQTIQFASTAGGLTGRRCK